MRALKEDRGFGVRPVESVRRSVVQDMGRASKKVLDFTLKSHRRLARKEGALRRWDVQGLDHGNKNVPGPHGIRMSTPDVENPIRRYPVAPRSAAQTAASKRNIVRAQAARAHM
jgi:hypothetical protein